jgi:ABC-type oligopeptide transport system substrate-binding subunit
MRALALVVLLSACHRDPRYLGNTKPPLTQRLVYANALEPATLDPDLVSMGMDANIQQCLFEGLAVNNPLTSQPMAGMATHYEVSADGKEYTFYLRGHPHPKGNRLADIGALPPEFSHGVPAPPDSVPARWSNGTLVTAGDFVYSWRRLVDPRTASANASDPAMVVNALDIVAGKRGPDQLGVEALDDFTLRVRLVTPAPYFVSVVAQPDFMPVPRNTVVRRDKVIGNGPFVLAEWRPYDLLRVRKNPIYYERDLVRLDEISFLPVKEAAAVNLYQAGLVQNLYESAVPAPLVPALKSTRDFRHDPQTSSIGAAVNLRDPPFDNQMLRWAINMAIDKRVIADYYSSEPALRLVPALPGYTPLESLPVSIHGKRYDVLAYNPGDAREVLAAAGYPDGIDAMGKRLTFPINTSVSDLAETIRYQLKKNLKIEPQVNFMEFSVLYAAQSRGDLAGLTLSANTLSYPDPYGILAPWFTDFLGWHDRDYAAHLDEANRTLDPQVRMRKLAQCEARFMEAMPMIPISWFPNLYLAKPYLRGMKSDLFAEISFRYAWIDTGWKP